MTRINIAVYTMCECEAMFRFMEYGFYSSRPWQDEQMHRFASRGQV